MLPVTTANPELYQFLIALHLIGLTFGLGAASISDFTFMGELLKKGKIEPTTVERMRSFSQLVWIGLGLLGVSGVGLLMIEQGQPLQLPGFIAKMVVVAILLVNGVMLNFYITPRLAKFSFEEKYRVGSAAWRARKLTFIFGAVSVTSWYGAFFIAMFKTIVLLPFIGYLAIYLGVLAFAVFISLLVERKLSHPYIPLNTQPAAAQNIQPPSVPAPSAPGIIQPQVITPTVTASAPQPPQQVINPPVPPGTSTPQ